MQDPTQPKTKRFYKRWWFWTLAVIVLFIIIAASNNSSPKKVGTAQTASTDNSSDQTVFKIGDQVKRGDTVLTVTSVDKNWKSSNQFDKPQNPGDIFVVVNVSLANQGTSDMSLSGAFDFKLTDAQGVQRSESITGGIGLNRLDSSSATSLSPGGTISGALVFEVPSTATSKMSLTYQPLFSLGKPATIQLQ